MGQDICGEPGHCVLGGSSGRWQLGDPCPSPLPAVLLGSIALLHPGWSPLDGWCCFPSPAFPGSRQIWDFHLWMRTAAVGLEPGAGLEEIWGKFISFYLLLDTGGWMRGLLAPLSPATTVGESLELPTGNRPPWNAFCLHPGQGAGSGDFLMSAERLKCGMWTPSKIFTRQQRVSRVVGSLRGRGQVRSLSHMAPTVYTAASLHAAGQAKRSFSAPSAGPAAS